MLRSLSPVVLILLAIASVPAAAQTCAPPNITVNGACGAPATLDAGAGYSSYLWSTGDTTQSITTDFGGTYSVTVTDGNGCASSASSTIVVDDFNVARVPNAACPGATITNAEVVMQSASTAISWSVTNGTITYQSNDNRHVNFTVDGSAAAVLTTTVDFGDGCVATKTKTINVAMPITSVSLTSSASGAVCPRTPVTLTATPNGGGGYDCSWTSYGDTVNSTNCTITVTPSSTSWYYVQVNDYTACGSATSNAVQVVVTSVDSTISAPSQVCANTVATASVPYVSGETYAWTIDGGGWLGSPNTSDTGFTPGANGSTLTVSVTNNGCTSTSAKFVAATNPPATPTITSSTGSTTLCPGSSTTLTASTAPSYQWSTGETTQSIVVSNDGTYSVTVTNGSCSSSNSVFIDHYLAPSAFASGDQAICPGHQATISAGLNGTAPFTVRWSDGLVQTITSGNSASRVVTPSSTTTYSLASMSDAHCSGSVGGTATVSIRTPPSATVSGGGTICLGGSATVSASLSGWAPFTVTWSDGLVQTTSSTSISRSVSPSATTIYSIASVSDNFCGGSASGSATVTVNAPPAITQQPSSQTVKKMTAVQLQVTATSSITPMTFQWYLGASGNTSSPIANATQSTFTTPKLSTTTSYWVRVTNGCGSTNSATATITVR